MTESLKSKAEKAKEKLKRKLSRRNDAPSKGTGGEKLLNTKRKTAEKPRD